MNDNLEKLLQEKVEMVAEALIKEFPEIAKNNPKEIGKMAKEIVFSAANKAIEIMAAA